MICDKEEKAESLLVNKEKGATPTLSCLVLFNDCSDAIVERGKNCGVEILELTQLMVSRGVAADNVKMMNCSNRCQLL